MFGRRSNLVFCNPIDGMEIRCDFIDNILGIFVIGHIYSHVSPQCRDADHGCFSLPNLQMVKGKPAKKPGHKGSDKKDKSFNGKNKVRCKHPLCSEHESVCADSPIPMEFIHRNWNSRSA